MTGRKGQGAVEKYAKELEVVNCIIKNIEERGMYRYDRMDFKWNPQISLKTAKLYKVRPIILAIEEFFPYALRKLAHIEKRILPTTYTFIANAYYFAEKNGIPCMKSKTAEEIMEECIKEYLTIEDGMPWWNYEKELFGDVVEEFNSKRPTMHMHGLARCNMLLIRLGIFKEREEWLKIAYDSAMHTMEHHLLEQRGENISISYFYNTRDCVINVNSEFAMWLGMLKKYYHSNEKIDRVFSGIVKMIIAEQNELGGWAYYSKEYITKYGKSDIIDCHHNGTILYNLISIFHYEILEDDLQKKVRRAIDKGMNFYIKKFFSKPTKVKSFIGLRRPAGPTQYSEAIFAFCEYLKNSNKLNPSCVKKIKKILPAVLKKDMDFIEKDGSSKSEKVIKWVNIDSIRWGNGPVLEAIMRYIDYMENN